MADQLLPRSAGGRHYCDARHTSRKRTNRPDDSSQSVNHGARSPPSRLSRGTG